MKKIVLTGGGTAGHVTPNIALLPALYEAGYEVNYIGSKNGMERKLIEELNVPYYGISSGKLRRSKDPKTLVRNFIDLFRVARGCFQAERLMRKLKPDIVFSKGGFVTVPVVWAAHRKKIPTILHESDITPGLANRICIKVAKANKICANFPETLNHLPAGKAILTGSPIRQELFTGDKYKGLSFCGFTTNKPTILIIGGSLGSAAINEAVRGVLSQLLENFNIIHLCGKGKLDTSLCNIEGYVQFEYIKDELRDLFALADLIISRAGANAICELLALKKPNILIPLSAAQSRGDQILNADSFKKQGFSYVIKEEDVTSAVLLDAVKNVYNSKEQYITAMEQSAANNAIPTIVNLINENAL